MKDIKELIELIENWANEKGLLVAENAPKQYLKTLEEIGEVAHEILHEDWEKAKLEFGDVAVTAIILYKQLNQNSIEPEIDRTKNLNIFPHDFSILTERVSSEFISKHFLLFLSDLTRIYKLDLKECLNLAWEKIKNRTGKTENGTFKKDLKSDNCFVGDKSICFMTNQCELCEFKKD